MSNVIKAQFVNEAGQYVQGVSVNICIPGAGYAIQAKVTDDSGVVTYGSLSAQTMYTFKASALGYKEKEYTFTTGNADQSENATFQLETADLKTIGDSIADAAKASNTAQVINVVQQNAGSIGDIAKGTVQQAAENVINTAADADANKAKGWIDDRQSELEKEIATTKNKFVQARDKFQLEALNILEQSEAVDLALVAFKIKASRGIQDLLDKLF